MGTGEEKGVNNFKNRRVFTNQKEYWGIPSNLFIGGAGLIIGISFLVVWWAGLALAGVYFPVMYHIHKQDPRAIQAWMRGIKRKNSYWVAGDAEPVQLQILSSRGGQNQLKKR
jgi:type IV secretory pathway TrbD component